MFTCYSNLCAERFLSGQIFHQDGVDAGIGALGGRDQQLRQAI